MYASSKLLVYYHTAHEKAAGQPPRGQRALSRVTDDAEAGPLVLVVHTLDPPKPRGASVSSARYSASSAAGQHEKPLMLKFASNVERETWRSMLGKILDGVEPLPTPDDPSTPVTLELERTMSSSI